MPHSIEFWFEFASSYSYPAALRIDAAAQRAGVRVLWRPFLLGPLFRAQGYDRSPFVDNPLKGRYMWRDVARLCAKHGIAFRQPSVFPRTSVLGARIACAFQDEPWVPAFVRALYQASFADDLDIGDPAIVADCLQRCGQPAAERIGTAQAQPLKDRLRAQTEQAAAHGIFGAPSLRVGAELFWGSDRLEDAIAWACGTHPLPP